MPHLTTADRGGRTVKLMTKYQWIFNIKDQKAWIDYIGPIVTFFETWQDFHLFRGQGVYRKMQTIGDTGQPNFDTGGHALLVVGYNDPDKNDPDGYWIVKNSWGPNWGDGGFAKIAYGECEIDSRAKIGQVGTDPDPWAKRRLHAGNLLESGKGSLLRDFEMVATTGSGGSLRHWRRDNSTPGLPWVQATTFADDAAACPAITASTYDRELECVYLTNKGQLHNWYFDQSIGQWRYGDTFGTVAIAGAPGFIQVDEHAPGDFVVVAMTSGHQLLQMNRCNGAPWPHAPGEWYEDARFGSGVSQSGPSLLQSRRSSSGGAQGDLHVVCAIDGGQMQHWQRIWGGDWTLQETFGSGVASPPCMIEGQWGMQDELGVGNFELCVAVGGSVQHWWRDNSGQGGWQHATTFGHDVASVLGLLEGSFESNFEVVVLTTGGMLQHYWRDANLVWHEGVVIGHA